MTPDMDNNLISIWQRLLNTNIQETPKEEKKMLLDIFNAFQKHTNKIWQCNIEELNLIRRKFTQLELSGPARLVLTRIDQTINIYNIAKEDVSETLAIIKRNDIRDQNLLFTIAKICAQQNGWGTAENITDFNITDQNRLSEIAKICAKQYGWGTAKNITGFNITDHNKLFEIAKICAGQNGRGIAEYIRNFHITDQDKLFEIAKLCAKQDGGNAARYIKCFNIEDKERLFEIAKICAEQYGWVTAENIKNFELLDHNKLSEIAKLCARQYGWGTAKNIKNFNITNQDKLFEIAKLCATEDGGGTAENIRNFNITDQNQLFEIAKICAREEGGGTARHIQNFGIDNCGRIFEIAKICAEQNGWGTAKNIRNFKITDQDRLFEIAKICARQNGWGTAENIQNLNIADRDRLFEIAKICAQQSGGGTAENIRNFNITDQDRLFEIAKLCAEQDGWGTTYHIANFYIANRDKIFEIAKLCAEQDGGGTAENMENFAIGDQDRLFEIAKICAGQNVGETVRNLENFHIADENRKRQIVFLAIKQNPRNIKYWKHNLETTLLDLYEDPFEIEEAEDIINSFIEKRLPGIGFEQLVARTKENPEYVRRNLLQNLGSSLFLLTEQCTDEQIRIVQKLRLIEALQDFRRPDLRWGLSWTLIDAAAQSALKNITPDKRKSPETRLIDLLKARLVQKGVEKKKASKLEKIIKKDRELLKNAAKSHVVIEALFRLAEESAFNQHQLNDITTRLARDIEGMSTKKRGETLFRELRSVNSLILMEKSQYLSDSEDIFAALEKGFRNLIPLEDIDDFANKYLNSFGSSRDPGAIITYAAKIASLNDSSAEQALGRFISSVLENTFTVARYKAEDNIHLNTIREYEPAILEKWQKILDPLPLSAGVAAETQTFDAEEWLYRKLVKDRHLKSLDQELPSLFGYLKRDNKKENVDGYLREIRDKKSGQKKEAHQIFMNIERLCLRLLTTNHNASILGLLNNLKKILDKPPFNTSEFLNDVNGLIEALRETKKRDFSNFVAIETNDYMDLLLCGTEVMGSCQRIDGSPHLNKGLLGYLLDGKNHLLAIKTQEKQRGRIKVRCLLKLLWDGEKPVLFRERFYPDPIEPEYETILNRMAARKAENLGIPLLSLDEYRDNYPKTLYALGGPAPFEYSDGSHGLEQNGKYSINGATFLKP